MLEAEAIAVRFGGVRAVDEVSLQVTPGEVSGLIGPNGSGKSTFLNALTGVVAASGSLAIDGRAVPLGRPRRSRSAGLVRSYQTPQTYVAFTCEENVALGTSGRWRGLTGAVVARIPMVRQERTAFARSRAALDRVGLAGLAATPSAGLTFGQQRMLELARVIAAQPSYLLLDEPSAGLNDQETDALAGLLTGLRDEGIGMLLVDHKVDFIDRVCARITVLELGRVIASGPPADVWRLPRVMDAYLGGSAGA